MRMYSLLRSLSALTRRSEVSVSSKPRLPRLTLEALEERTLLSGNPAATVVIPVSSPFFHNGQVYDTDLNSPQAAKEAIYEPNGDILIIGQAPDPIKTGTGYYVQDFAVTRLLPDGTFDTSFGNGGTVITSLSNGDDSAQDVLVQPDGKIVVVGTVSYPGNGATTGFGIVRYNADGSLDASFGTDGKVVSTFGGVFAEPQAVALQPDGKIVVVGDSTVGVGQQELDGKTGELQTVAPDTYISGSQTFTWPFSYARTFTVARYNSDGSLDASFAQGGVSQLNLDCDGMDVASAVQVGADGKILVTGFAGYGAPVVLPIAISGIEEVPTPTPPPPANSGPVAVQYNPDGTLDTTFGDHTFGTGGIQFGSQIDVEHASMYQIAFPPSPPNGLPAAPPVSTTPGGDVGPTPAPVTSGTTGGDAEGATASADSAPVFIAYVTTPAGSADATNSGPPAAPVTNLTALYLEAMSITGGLPVGAQPLPGGGYGVIGFAPVTGTVPASIAPSDFYRTQISGGGSVLVVDGPTDPFAPLTTGDFTPVNAFDMAGDAFSPPGDGVVVPQAVRDAVFASLPTVEAFRPQARPIVAAPSAQRPAIAPAAANVVAPPPGDALPLTKPVGLGLAGIGLAGAGLMRQRKRRKGFWPFALATSASR
ncbi:MAG TPA: hypothetical protein DDY78_02575 [Planctomycetales bacterium]|nr:hypothetical protein [Planctomycetales bacterium]